MKYELIFNKNLDINVSKKNKTNLICVSFDNRKISKSVIKNTLNVFNILKEDNLLPSILYCNYTFIIYGNINCVLRKKRHKKTKKSFTRRPNKKEKRKFKRRRKKTRRIFFRSVVVYIY